MIFTIAFRNVIKNWRQSLASIISISAAFFTLTLFQGYLFDIQSLFETIYRHRMMFGDVIVENKDLYSLKGRAEPWNFNLNPEQQKFISDFIKQEKQSVITQVRFLKMPGMIANGHTSVIFSGYGYDIDAGAEVRGERWGWNALYGQPLDVAKNPQGLLVGQTLARLLSCHPERQRNYSSLVVSSNADHIGFKCDHEQISMQLSATTKSGQLNAIDADVVGFVDGGFRDVDSKFINMSLENAQMLMGTNDISHETILLKDSKLGANFILKAQKAADEAQMPLKFQTWKDHRFYGDSYVRTMDLLGIFRNFVVIIILTIATLSVLNTLIKVVKERTREIGTLRSLGYTKSQISIIFIFEAAGLAFLGNIVGLISAIICSVIINHSGLVYKAGMFVEPAPLTVAINFMIYFQSFIFLCLLAMLAAVFALRSTLRNHIAENLAYA